ncbi:hypothetical protein C7212DRAFT_363975 [Tuber magnatum]|uniref:Uncharacterized protein n=1 Tax=Tuber magnatum TaxID=42249 RepID=A0A317SSQ3_9PEZI|nr:hypothetical protein C7212DRAFT_363975 [Tuber magnatum]
MRGFSCVTRLLRWKDRHVNKVKPARIGHPAVQLHSAFDTHPEQNGHRQVAIEIANAKVESLRDALDRLEAEFQGLILSFPDPNPQVVAYTQWKLEKGFEELVRGFGDITVRVKVHVEDKSMVADWSILLLPVKQVASLAMLLKSTGRSSQNYQYDTIPWDLGQSSHVLRHVVGIASSGKVNLENQDGINTRVFAHKPLCSRGLPSSPDRFWGHSAFPLQSSDLVTAAHDCAPQGVTSPSDK